MFDHSQCVALRSARDLLVLHPLQNKLVDSVHSLERVKRVCAAVAGRQELAHPSRSA
jgi:hypothetical protein